MKKSLVLALVFATTWGFKVHAQQTPPAEYGSGLKVDLNDDGSKYFRLITWHQFWLDMNETPSVTNPGETDFTVTPMLRRSRFLLYAQLSDRFLILTHFGLNSLTPAGLDPTGQSSQAQLFMHDAWVEYKVFDELYLGGGLHYWNGISRLNNQSTLNFLSLDNPRFAWASIGTSDQFARHLGIYAKGKIGKLDYRVAWNGAMVNSVDANAGLTPNTAQAIYTGRSLMGAEAANVFAGYFNYQFWDQESNKLPYFVGSYLGKKKVLSVGAGFYQHSNGSVIGTDPLDATQFEGEDVLIFAADAFMELPIGDNNQSITAYASYQNNNYGTNYQLGGGSLDVFTGSVLYAQAGYLLPNTGAWGWQPYVTFAQKSITNGDASVTDFGVGINSLVTGHNAKLSLEYRNVGQLNGSANRFILQAVVFL